MSEVLDEVVDAAAVWKSERWGRCLDTSEPCEILDRLEREALHRLRADRDLNRPVWAAERAIRHGASCDVVTTMVGADRRRLVPAFRAAVGLAPKHYQRIVRFQRALRALRTPGPASLATIAATCGYADQSHLSRDFKEFSGLTPGRVHGAASSAHNHVPVTSRESR